VSQDLTAMGYKAGAVSDSSSQSQPVGDDTQVFYGAGNATDASAQMIANVMGVQSARPLSSLPAGQVEVLLGSQVTAQAPGLEMFGADTVNALDYVSAAAQNGQSIPANAQAAANTGSQSDVPAYSEALSTPSASASSGSAVPAGSSASTPVPGTSSPARKPTSSASTTPSPPYGLTTCPY
jgi:LytR cell envelope-related transcriptional attenuator